MPRKNMSKVTFKITAKLHCAVFIAFACLASASAQNPVRPEEETLRAFLRTQADDKGTRYVAVFRDLNGDGKPEALVYLVGGEWCGSGGCTLFILQKDGGSWKVVSSVSITYPPVEVLSTLSSGWQDLNVHVGGGGARPGVVTLRFNGKSYRKSPPDPKRGKNASGEVVIDSWEAAKPLF
jgi:hypothetical protein